MIYLRLFSLAFSFLVISCSGAPEITKDYVELHATLSPEDDARSVDDFTGIAIDGKIILNVHRENDHRVVIHASKSLLDYIETEVRRSVLRIGMRDGYSAPDYQITADVWLPKLESIAVDGDCNVIVGKFKCDDLKLTILGDSKLRLENISAESIDATIEGNSKLDARGSTEDLQLLLRGDSKVDGESLIARNTIVQCIGRSRAEIHSTGSLSAYARGASQIDYIGDPRTVSRDCGGASRIRQQGGD